jgi:DNA polymerase III delta prime subunit
MINTTENEFIKWVDKYRPTNISDMILTDELKTYFNNMLSSKKFVNMTLCASPGIGKTTLAKALTQSANAEILFLNCASGDGKVEAIQTKLIPFTQSMPFDDRPMFVILDELDSASATSDSSFQKALRNVIESAPNCTFICTANYGNKIIPAVLSRCPQIKLTFSAKDVLVRVKTILDSENIKYSTTNLKEFVNIAIKAYYPDIRTIINLLQSCCTSGELLVNKTALSEVEKNDFLNQLSDKILNEKDILNIRKFYLQNKDKINDFTIFAGEIFNYMLNNNLISDKEIIVKAADIIYQMNLVVDKEISFFQFITQLSMIQK